MVEETGRSAFCQVLDFLPKRHEPYILILIEGESLCLEKCFILLLNFCKMEIRHTLKRENLLFRFFLFEQ